MKKLTIVLCLMLVFAMQAEAQKKKPAPKVKQEPQAEIRPKQESPAPIVTGYPIQIILAGIKQHRVTERVGTLSFMNVDEKRTVSSIKWWVKAYDTLTKRITADFSFEAEPSHPVAPKQIGEVADLLDEFFPETSCVLFIPKRMPSGSGKGYFYLSIPSSCKGDLLFIDIRKVDFTDGSKWEAPDAYVR